MKTRTILCLALLAVVLQAGCASSQKDLAKQHLIEAKAMIHTAKLMDGESISPEQMSAATAHLKKADAEFNKNAKAGWLSDTLVRKKAYLNTSIEQSVMAKKAAENAIMMIKQQKKTASGGKNIPVQRD